MKKHIFVIVAMLVAAIVASRYLPWWGAILLILATLGMMVAYVKWSLKRWWRNTTGQGMDMVARPLVGAAVTLHDVRVVTPPPDVLEHEREMYEPDDDDDDDEDADEDDAVDLERLRPAYYVAVDMTITPAADLPPLPDLYEDDPPENTWSPSNFRLVPHDAGLSTGMLDAMGFGSTPQAIAFKSEQLDANGEPITPPPGATAQAADATLATNAESDDATDIAEDEIKGPARVRVIFGIRSDFPQRTKLRYWVEDLCELKLPHAS
ncbi:MAG: hypothetical protein H6817_07565 [Phycisphaerales bacterium]|nr:hypothetical protein [Phycisphaerales bacterium]